MGILINKVAIVTGAGQGVGRGIALALAKEGAAVAIPEINYDAAITTVSEIKALGGRALAIACDVGKREQVNAAVAATIKEFGTVDILVNNAQWTCPSEVPIEDVSDEAWDKSFGSGVNATFYFMQACFPYMKGTGGKIINFASMAGTEGLVGRSAYAANKEAVRGLSRVAAHEWGQYNITTNVILPWSNAPSWEMVKEKYPDLAAAAVAANPMRRVGDPEKDVGRAVVYLCSPDASFINNLNLPVDGGQANLR